MQYYAMINGEDVWVTVEQPYMFDTKTRKFVQSQQYCAAFRFDKAAGVVIGEHLRDEKKQLRWFPNADAAANAAFDEAAGRIGR